VSKLNLPEAGFQDRIGSRCNPVIFKTASGKVKNQNIRRKK
jgi:hypothetical protein